MKVARVAIVYTTVARDSSHHFHHKVDTRDIFHCVYLRVELLFFLPFRCFHILFVILDFIQGPYVCNPTFSLNGAGFIDCVA